MSAALLGACLLSPVLLLLPQQLHAAPAALPTGLQVVSGQASVVTQGVQLTVRNTPGAVLNWQSFNIGAANRVYFDQASAASKVLNRVVGNDPSLILGNLASNGQVWLLNPNGVLFGQGARVDVQSLVASTLRLNDSDFTAGRYSFNAVDGSKAAVSNAGSLRSSFGGQIVLLGASVANSGDIQAPGGQISLAAGSRITLVDTGLPNLSVRVDVPAGEVLNLGRLSAPGGKVDVHAAIVNQQGVVAAESLSVGALGQIVLQASDSLVLGGSSSTTASGGTGNRGGDISLTAASVELRGQAVVDASGGTAGGRIRVGGGAHGQDSSLANAATVSVAAGARISADALDRGDGGTVVVWADGTAQVHGSVSARGGAQGGDGGFIETSGKRLLDLTRAADASAPQGRAGTWLLDPYDITVQAAAGSLDAQSPGFTANANSSTVSNAVINTALNAGTSVTLDTGGSGTQNGDITVAAAISKTAGGDATLTLRAARNINLNANIGSTVGALNLQLVADQAGGGSGTGATVLGNATVALNGGALTATANGGRVRVAGGSFTLNAANATFGQFDLQQGSVAGSGNIVVNGAFNATGTTVFLTGSGTFTTQGVSTISMPGTANGILGISKPWTNNGTLTVAGDDLVSLGYSAGFVAVSLTNTASGTINLGSSNATPLTSYFSTTTVNNAGTVNSTVAGTHALQATTFNNTGSVNVTAGTLNIGGSGSDSGLYAVAAGSTLGFASGTRTLDSGSNITGTGTLAVSGGTVNASSALDLANTGAAITVSGGTLNLGSGVTGTLAPAAIATGRLNFNGTSAVTLSSLTLRDNGTLGGSGDVLIAGAFDVTGGSPVFVTGSGLLTTQAASTINLVGTSSTYLALTRRWTNNGSLSVVGDGSVFLGYGGDGGAPTLTNAGSGTVTFNSSAANVMADYNSNATVNNAGTVNQLATGVHTLEAQNFNNSGAVNVGNGTLAFSGVRLGGGTDTGHYDIAAGSTLRFVNTTRTVGDGFLVTGAGRLELAGFVFDAALDFHNSSPITLPNLHIVDRGSVNGSGDVIVAGQFDVTGERSGLYGGGGFTTQGTSTVNMPGFTNAIFSLSRPWTNSGTLTVGGDDLVSVGYSGGGATVTLTNTASGTINLSSTHASPLANFFSTLTLDNAGTINATVAGTHAVQTTTFNNSGNVNITAGTLNIGGGGTDTGLYTVPAGSTLAFVGGGTRTLASGSNITGSGTLAVSGGTVNANSALDLANTGAAITVSGGTLNLGSGVAGTLAPVGIDSGRLNFNGTSAVTLPSLTLRNNGTLGGSGDVVIAGAFDVSGGDPVFVTGSGLLTTQAASTINLVGSSSTYLALTRRWTNNGSLSLVADSILLLGYGGDGGAPTLTNASSGSITLNSSAAYVMADYNDNATVNNAGTVNHVAAGAHRLESHTFNNTGAVNVVNGTLAIDGKSTGGGNDTGHYDIAAGSTLQFISTTRTIGDGFGVSGAGALELAGSYDATLDFHNTSPITLPRLRMVYRGVIDGPGDVIIAGAFDAFGERSGLYGSGRLTTQGTSTVDIAGVSGSPLTVSRTWINTGTLTVGGDDLVMLGNFGGPTSVLLSNAAGGTLNLSSTHAAPLTSFFTTATVDNAGTLNSTVAGTHALQVSSLNNTGTLNVSSGTLLVDATLAQRGLVDIAAGATFQTRGSFVNQTGAVLAGSGSIVLGGSGGTLTNQGTLRPGGAGSVGTLSLTGNLVTAGTLEVDLGGPGAGASDRLAVTGNATLGGALVAALTGGYVPANADAIGFITTTGTASGNFSSLTLPHGFTAGYNLAPNEAARLIYAAGGSTKVFTNAAGDLNWATPTNWGGSLPEAGDTALLSAGYAVLHDHGSDTVGTLTINSNNVLNVSGGSLAVVGSTSLAGTLNVSGSGAATLNGALAAAGGTVNLQGGNLALNGAASIAALTLSGGTLNGSGSLAVTDSLARSGNATLGSGFSSISLSQASGTLAPGALSAGAVALTVRDGNGLLLIDDSVSSTGALTATSAGGLQLAGANAALTAGGDVTLAARSATLAGAVNGQHVQLSTTAGVQLTGAAVLMGSAGGDAIVVNAGAGPFVNTAGANALQTIGGGRWLVYSADPGNDTVGGLAAAFRQYNITGGTAPVAAGNGLLYSLAPTLVASLQGSVTKVYDGSTVASLQAANYAVGGALASDAVVLGNTASGSYASGGTGATPKDAGTGKLVQVAGLTAVVTDRVSGIPVYGYGFSGTAAGTVGSITAAPLAVTGLMAQDKVYDSMLSAMLSGTATINAIGGDAVSLAGSAAAAFGDKNVGTAKPVFVTGLGLVGADASNYSLQLPQLQAGISAAPLAVTGLTALSKTYDGTTQAALAGLATVVPLGNDVLTLGGTATASFDSRNVGTARPVTVLGLTLGGADAGNYLLQQPAGLRADITARSLNLADVVVANKVYDGNAVAGISGGVLTGTVGDDAVALPSTLAGSFVDRNAGLAKPVTLATPVLTGADAGNYVVAAPAGLQADITPRALAVTGLAAASKVYDAGLAATLSGNAAVAPLAGDSVALAGTVSGSFVDKNAGQAKPVAVAGLALSGADAGNYTVQAPTDLTADITPAALAVTGLVANNKVYDSTVTATLGGTALVTAYAGDAVTLAGNASAVFDTRNVGNAKSVSVSGIALTGADAGNYSLQQPAGLRADITPRPLALAGLSAASKVYDAGTAANVSGTLTGAVAGDSVVLGAALAGQFNDKNVGNGKAVALSPLSLAGADAGNYMLTAPTGLVADITPLALALTGLTATGKVYDATTATLLVGTAGVSALAGDSLALAGTASGSFADKNVGLAKPVVVSGLTLAGADAGNYTLRMPTGLTAAITPAALAVTGLTAASKVYDGGRAATLAGTALVSTYAGDAVTLAGTASAAFDTRNVANAKTVLVSGIALAGADAGNYSLQQPAGLRADITPRPLALAGLAAANKVYDAGTAANVSGTLAGAVVGDSVALGAALAGQFTDKNVGNGKAVLLSPLSLAGADAGNYTLTAPTGLVADITPLSLVLTGLTAAAKVYDTTTAALLVGTAGVAALAGDSVTLAGAASGSFADKNVGQAKAVVVGGLQLAGADAGNYRLLLPTGLTASITPAPLLVTGLSVADKVYDGSSAATLLGSASVAALGTDSVLVGGSGSASFDTRNAGVAKPVVASGFALAGADAGNYTVQQPVGLVATVTPRMLTAGSVVAADKVYDGNVAATATGALAGAVAGDAVGLSLAARFGDANAGADKPVAVQLQLAGADAANYGLAASSLSTTASITPAMLRYVAAPVSAVAGTVLPTLTGSVAGLVGGDTLAGSSSGTLLWSTPATVASLPGSYAIDGSGLAALNYRFEQAAGNASALRLTLTAPGDNPVPDVINTSFVQGLTAVTLPVAMSTPTSGRVVDLVQAFAFSEPSQGTAGVAAGIVAGTASTGIGNAAQGQDGASSEPAATDRRTTLAERGSAPSPRAFALDGILLEGLSYRGFDFSRLRRDEVETLLEARARYKRRLFASAISKLQIDPALADVRTCSSEAELATGNCLLTDTLKQQIDAVQARSAQPALRKAATARKVKQAVLPRIERKLALLIGINAYADKRVPQLEGAVPDARAVRDLLESRLGYETTVLEDPSRDDIVRAFNKLALEADANDSVVVYYAGHGVVVPPEAGAAGKGGNGGNGSTGLNSSNNNSSSSGDAGYWLPADSDADKPETWLANADISRLVGLLGARQVLLISDSCYSGTLAGNERVQLVQKTDAADLLARKAVVVMSSGGDEPVSDEGRDGHSVFAWHLMDNLKDLSSWQVGGSVFDRVRTAVSREFPQTPQYGASRGAGHQGNTDYLFEQREIERLAPQSSR